MWDSTDAKVQRTGDWSEETDAKALAFSLLKSRSARVATLTWHANLPREGYYTLHVRLASQMTSGQLTAKASYQVKHADGISVIPVNQAGANTEWLELGAFRFGADPDEGVTLVAGADGLTTLADGIRFAQAPFDVATRFTVEAWVRFEDTTLKWSPIVTKGSAWGLSLFGDTGRLTFFTGEGGGINHLVSREPLEPGIWVPRRRRLRWDVKTSVHFGGRFLRTVVTVFGGNHRTVPAFRRPPAVRSQ
jgi:hypothetical protein